MAIEKIRFHTPLKTYGPADFQEDDDAPEIYTPLTNTHAPEGEEKPVFRTTTPKITMNGEPPEFHSCTPKPPSDGQIPLFQTPNANPNVAGFLDGINGYLAQLNQMDLPKEFLTGIVQVLTSQVSQLLGEQVSPAMFEKPQVPAQTTEAPSPTCQTTGSGKAPKGMPAELWKGCLEASKKTGVDPYILAAQMEKESRFGEACAGSPSGADGLMQVEPSTREAYAAKFQAKMGHAYLGEGHRTKRLRSGQQPGRPGDRYRRTGLPGHQGYCRGIRRQGGGYR